MWPEDGGAGSRTRHKPHIAALILLPYKIPFEWFYRLCGADMGLVSGLLPLYPRYGSSLFFWCASQARNGQPGQLCPWVSRSIVSLIARTTKAFVLSPMLAACS